MAAPAGGGIRMKRRVLLAGLVAAPPLLAGHGAAAGAQMPLPDDFAFNTGPLEAVQEAVRRGTLTVVAAVGPVLSREAARDPASIYPNQVVTRLRQAWPKVTVTLGLLPIANAETVQFSQLLSVGLAQYKPALVIWGAGGTAAARGDDLDSFHGQVHDAIQAVQTAGANLILMTPQYAPMVARLLNLPPYRQAVLQEAQQEGIPVLDRYELLHFWNDNAILDLDATDPVVQASVARIVNEWIAEILADGIIRAVG
ncbi:MAG: hypothetical protein ACJ8AI_13390 [Rhodopila sp.]